MVNYAEFIKANRAKMYELADKNTPRNAAGDAVIKRDDPWFRDDIWDADYKELIARDDSTARRVVR